jgi:uncharacterized protein YegL
MNYAELIEGAKFISKEEEEKRQRLERFSQFFNRVNSAFAFRKVIVKVENSSLNAPAWSSANEVTFNSRMIGDLKDAQSIAGIKGLNLHELSHILFTPRSGSDLVDWVVEKKFWQAFNALEDARIERMFTTRFPSSIKWFTATILIHFVEKPDTFKTSYPLLRGRRYLPVELRARSRNEYPEQHNIPEICDIVDQYRSLVFPTDTEKGKELIERFMAILPKGKDDGSDEGSGEGGKVTLKPAGAGEESDINVIISDPFGHGQRPNEELESSIDSRPQTPKQQKQTQGRADQTEKPDDADLADQLQNNKPTIELNADQIEWDNNSDSDDSNVDSDDSNNDSDDSSSGVGKGVAELIATTLQDILDDYENAKELNNIIRQIGGLPSLQSNDSREPELDTYKSLTPDLKTVEASVAFAREIERLKAQYDPAWQRHEASGRLNVSRLLRGDDHESIFDQWNEGIEDVCEISCVIILDNSGSMTGAKASSAYKAMYAIKKALDRVGAETTVITFNDQTRTLYRVTDKASNVVRDAGTGGGTEPDEAIRRATKILAETNKPVRIFFAITDGEWNQNPNNEDAIDRMARAGVLTAFAYIPDGGDSIELTRKTTHNCEIGAVVRNPLDLINMARSIVKYAVNRRLVNR